jgi:hypothetical protein
MVEIHRAAALVAMVNYPLNVGFPVAVGVDRLDLALGFSAGLMR